MNAALTVCSDPVPAIPQRPEIIIRPAGPSDEAFIFQTWLYSHKRGSYDARRIRDQVFYSRHHALIESIMARGAAVLIAHPVGDPDTILGYVVAEIGDDKPVLHWCYVKLPWRRLGVATRLIEAAIPDPNRASFTHWTVWTLSVPAPKGCDRGDRKAIREGRTQAIRDSERRGDCGGDTDDLLRKWPGMIYDPYLRVSA